MGHAVRLAVILALTELLLVGMAGAGESLPRPPGLEPEIAFWRKIFGEVSTQEALVHDNRHLGVVYAKLDLSGFRSDGARRREMDATKAHYARILSRLATGDRTDLGPDERRVLALWSGRPSNDTLLAAAARVRIQQGLADRFLTGLIRSGRWEEHIRANLARSGVPEGLGCLPHVESSFNPEARSYVGAAGLWQFTAGTGRRFMRVDTLVDERRDPYRSSEAAARLLRANYGELQSWPLAITAYNHGTGGMRRAIRIMGTDNIETIVRNYDGPGFGFASRNFYVSLLAAEDVQREAAKYFGSVEREAPEKLTAIEIPWNISAHNLGQTLGLDQETLKAYNPALLAPVWAGKKPVPQAYTLRLPPGILAADALGQLEDLPQFRLAGVPEAGRLTHRVRGGETLSGIARQYGLGSATLARLNHLSKKNVIRSGQVLRLSESDAKNREDGRMIPRKEAGEHSGKPHGKTYVVRPGDSLVGIARRTGVTQGQLMSFNLVNDPNRIFPGQRLRLEAKTEGG